MPRDVNLFLVLLSFKVLLIFSFEFFLFVGLTYPESMKSVFSKADFLYYFAGEFAQETQEDDPGEIRIWPWPWPWPWPLSALNTNP